MLLGAEGGAPPSIVDGAIAGLGAVLGEMHREGLFTVAHDGQSTGIWALTCAQMQRFACCPSLLQDILMEGDDSGLSTDYGEGGSERYRDTALLMKRLPTSIAPPPVQDRDAPFGERGCAHKRGTLCKEDQ